MADQHLSRERLVHAAPATVFAVLTDIDQHAVIDGSGMVQGRAQGPRPLVMGSVFSMSMHQVVGYRTRNTVVEYEADRLIAWETRTDLGPVRLGGHRWRYELEPVADGTLVRETIDWSTTPRWYAALMSRSGYAARFGPAIEATLERLAAHVERGPG